MTIIWLVVLLIYGGVQGFATIPGLAWWLLLPLWFQDAFDTFRKKRQ